MPLQAWLAAAGVLALCLIWRLSYYVYWRNTFGGRPIKRKDKPADNSHVVTLDQHGMIKPTPSPRDDPARDGGTQ